MAAPANFSRQFFWLAATCAFGSALTTLAVHVLPLLWADATTFEQQVELRLNPIYMAQRWAVLIHCLLVIISMFGVGVAVFQKSAPLATLGFLSFFVFGITEIFRTALSIFAINRIWRTGYAIATDDHTRQMFRDFIAYGGINDALFFVFYTAFVLGLLCYGIALVRSPGADRLLGGLFLLWALVNIPVFIDTVAGGRRSLGLYFDWVGPYFQPVARMLIGIWLWRLGSRLADTKQVGIA